MRLQAVFIPYRQEYCGQDLPSNSGAREQADPDTCPIVLGSARSVLKAVRAERDGEG